MRIDRELETELQKRGLECLLDLDGNYHVEISGYLFEIKLGKGRRFMIDMGWIEATPLEKSLD